MCSHCHELAPAWRRLARELEGVIRMGAVNCEEDWVLCRQEGITVYPSLFVYPAVSYFMMFSDSSWLVTVKHFTVGQGTH